MAKKARGSGDLNTNTKSGGQEYKLSPEEQETVLCMSADDRSHWKVYSDDPVMQTMLEELGAETVEVAKDGVGRFYVLKAEQVFLGRKPRQWSDEARAAAAERMKRVRHKKGG